jgi:hypothetical protein
MLVTGRRLLCVAAMAIVAVLPVRASGGVVYTNLGAGGSFDGNDQFTVASDDALAVQFTPTANFIFTDAELALVHKLGTNLYDVSLATDSAGLPGTILETIALNGVLPTSTPALVTATSSLQPLLAAGSSYWLIVSAPDTGTQGGFAINSIGDLPNNNFAFSNTNTPLGPWTIDNLDQNRPAFQINGSLVPVPEPSSLFLLAISVSVGVTRSWVGRRQLRRP